jgi:hypothetical protein
MLSGTEQELAGVKATLAGVRDNLGDTKTERDKFDIELQNKETALEQAQNALAPWKELANSKFPDEPLTKRMDLLFGEMSNSVNEFHLDLQSFKDAISKIPTSSGTGATTPISNESANPLTDPIAAATATVELVVGDTNTINDVYLPSGCFAGFASGTTPLLIAAANQFSGRTLQSGSTAQFHADCVMSPDSDSVGKPISMLERSGYVQIQFSAPFPPNSHIISGHVTWVLNNKWIIKVDVPEQISQGTMIFVRDLNEALKALK